MEDLPLFRAPKRRKVNKPAAELEDDSATSILPGGPSQAHDIDEEPSKIIRTQRQHASRKVGINFMAASKRQLEENNHDSALTSSESSTSKLPQMPDRFMGSGGQIVNVDKHMLAYIDTQLSHQRQPSVQASATPLERPEASQSQNRGHTLEVDLNRPTNTPPSHAPHKLSEVSLPPKPSTPPPPRPRVRKPRLGRDGKPLPPRGARRRPSEDMARDQLVEQLLHQHRPDTPSATTAITDPAATHLADQTNDEAFAARFRADFLNQATERQARDEAKRTTQSKAAPSDAKAGPKLGGSRTDRAKMAQQNGAAK